MADMTADYAGAGESLGVGKIIGDTFGIFFKRIVQIISLGFIITFATMALSGLIVGFDMVAGSGDPLAGPEVVGAMDVVGIFLMLLLQFAGYGLLIGAMVLLAYDAKLGRSARTGTYIKAALSNIIPISILTLIVTVIAMIGFFLFVIPGLWIYAMLSVFVPAIVVERAGFKALGRSRSLTKDYRWPIVGLMIVLGLIMFVLSLALVLIIGLPIGLLFAAGGDGTMGILASLITQALASGISYGLAAIPIALIYARLREIKEGVSVDSMADVFK
ncbi:hypothetical protein [Ovoidimarina sediminis]|uniref:hypothetical protein n=1 Tax=Ovoidimarina sediminis TaxID=3079856 RepID=UPI00291220CA|nr:hypothetical protein [Rhodophyticola sp. MJ-SS7]MDU8942599.1 hypothetical protein [Rhodophyticola sp. MJ-SS7]